MVSSKLNTSEINIGDTGLFVRLGNLPKGGKSRNILTGKVEQGISVVPTIKDPKTNTLEIISGPFTPLDRPTFLVRGTVVGFGSDDEPVISNPKLIRKISKKELIRRKINLTKRHPS